MATLRSVQIVTSSEGNNGKMSAKGEKNRSVVSGQYCYRRYYNPRAFFFPKLLTLDVDAICFIILLDFYGVKSLRI